MYVRAACKFSNKKVDAPVKFLLKRMFRLLHRGHFLEKAIICMGKLKFHKCTVPQEQNENVLFPCSINFTGKFSTIRTIALRMSPFRCNKYDDQTTLCYLLISLKSF